MKKYFNFISATIWFTMLGQFLYNPHQYTIESTGIMLGLLGAEFAYHGLRDIKDEISAKK